MRIGVVPYINALPLYRYLPYPVEYDVPVALAAKLSQGQIDVALLPTVAFMNEPSLYPWLEGGVIQSKGPVQSVLLFVKKSVGEPRHIHSIRYSDESVTSNALLKVLLKYYWKADLFGISVTDKDPQAFLLIGDKTMSFESQDYLSYDLGRVWHEWTRLPFVYALWVSRLPLAPEVGENFRQAMVQGLADREGISRSVNDWPYERIYHYLTENIHYEVDGRSLEGMALFQEYCCGMGIVDQKRELHREGALDMPGLYRKIESGHRISFDEALTLALHADFETLGRLATAIARKKNGDRVAYLIDRNINYTNVCTARCSFCAFYRPHNHRESYTLSYGDIDAKIKETRAMGGRRILMQGGFHPEHTVDTYVGLVRHIRKNHPDIHIHAFSPPEIHHASRQSGITYDEVVVRLKEAGLGSIPGGGAEILADRVRDRIAVGKCSTAEWLAVCRSAQTHGISVTATMMMGHIETWEERIAHLDHLRALQDETRGFLSFIPWSFQPENSALHPRIKRNTDVKLAMPEEYLRLLAVARIYLDNFDHIQASLLTQGTQIAQRGLNFGADDLGSWLIEENVVRMAGCPQEAGLGREKMAAIIRDAGLVPYERDTFYNEIPSPLGK